jgi:hypothetical protein
MGEFVQMENVGNARQPRITRKGPIEAKTAAYQITSHDSRKIFTNRAAAGSVTFTLPAAADLKAGIWFDFVKATPGQNVVIALNSNTCVGYVTPFTGTTAVTHSTANERGSCRLMFDGAAFILMNQNGTWTIS